MLNKENLLNTKELKEILHIKGDSTIWRYIKEGKIPQPTLTISRSMRLWDKNELLAYLTAKSQENTQGGEL
ncbi:helix-turn-helix transcriptional regulator [Campylobacter devanensis]|uniref:helix-turn-helix transcriptional regulator n=1 Tax=Campylobacter devanensis TaxID=3161138 RepID=UPI000A3540D1|nr:helix-turn-helix domain-containing protein [Campylobacter sp. P0209]